MGKMLLDYSFGPASRGRAEPGADDFTNGMVLGITHNLDASAVLEYRVAFGNAVSGVVSSLGVNVGTNFGDEGANIRLGENDYRVYVGERRQNFRSFFGGHQGTALA